MCLFSRLTITASCPINLQYFPMDRQLCYIEIESCKLLICPCFSFSLQVSIKLFFFLSFLIFSVCIFLTLHFSFSLSVSLPFFLYLVLFFLSIFLLWSFAFFFLFFLLFHLCSLFLTNLSYLFVFLSAFLSESSLFSLCLFFSSIPAFLRYLF